MMTAKTAAAPEVATRVRRFAIRLTIGFIVAANALFLSALWVSGLDLDQVFQERDLFDPVQDICLRMAWYRLQGEEDPVRLCKEWINLKDASGQVHKFAKNAPITKGTDGKFYLHPATAGDGRLIALLIFVIVVVAGGMWAQRILIARYRARLVAGKPE